MNAAIVLASGSGIRLGGEIPKQFLELGGRAVFLHSLERLARHPQIDCLVLVCHPDWLERAAAAIARRAQDLILHASADLSAAALAKFEAIQITPGGETRMDSGWNGLSALPAQTRYAMIHDAARPFVQSQVIETLLAAARECGAAIPVLPCADTTVEIESAPIISPAPAAGRSAAGAAQPSAGASSPAREFIRAIPDRSRLRGVQTPQAFDLQLLRRAFDSARKAGIRNPTDDASLIHRLGLPVACIPGSPLTFKITTREDLNRAQLMLAEGE